MTATQGDLLRDAALEQVEANADAEWIAAAKAVVWALIKLGEPFTSDHIWRGLDERGVGKPREPRALGAVLRAAAKAGYIQSTGEWFKSERPENHSRPVAVWLPVRRAA